MGHMDRNFRALKRIAEICALAKTEWDITAYANALTAAAGLDHKNGYAMRPGRHMEHEEKKREPVFEIQSVNTERNISLVYCAMSNASDRIEHFMKADGFPHGILMHPMTVTFFSLDVETAKVQRGVTLYSLTDITQILQTMAGMRISELEE